jgi:hypothetical protein
MRIVKWGLLLIALAGAWFGYRIFVGMQISKQFEACLQSAYSIADASTRAAEDRSARYELEAINCAKRIEQDWNTCWPIGDEYAGNPQLCHR